MQFQKTSTPLLSASWQWFPFLPPQAELQPFHQSKFRESTRFPCSCPIGSLADPSITVKWSPSILHKHTGKIRCPLAFLVIINFPNRLSKCHNPSAEGLERYLHSRPAIDRYTKFRYPSHREFTSRPLVSFRRFPLPNLPAYWLNDASLRTLKWKRSVTKTLIKTILSKFERSWPPTTVRPLLSGHLLSGHPPCGHFPKSQNIRLFWYSTSITRPPTYIKRPFFKFLRVAA